MVVVVCCFVVSRFMLIHSCVCLVSVMCFSCVCLVSVMCFSCVCLVSVMCLSCVCHMQGSEWNAANFDELQSLG